MIVERTYKLRGVAPLVMHNSRLANPLDPLKRELSKLTAQKKKTDSVRAQDRAVQIHSMEILAMQKTRRQFLALNPPPKELAH